MKYKYNKEEVDVLETIKSAGRHIRKRSMEAIPMEVVLPLEISRHREIEYQGISDMEVCIGDYFTSFSLGTMVEEIRLTHTQNLKK